MEVTWNDYAEILMKKAAIQNIPFWGTFELTPRCNFKCKMCYICRPINDKEALARELTAKQWIRLAQQARDAGLLYLNLTGGEVLARTDFPEIYKELSLMGFNISILTNASLMNNRLAELFSRYMPSRVSTTVYGASQQTYGQVTGDASGYERTLKGINLLKGVGTDLILKMTVTRENAQDFDKIAEIAEQKGAKFAVVNYISPRREGNCTDPLGCRLSPKELAAFEAQVTRYNAQHKAEESASAEPCADDDLCEQIKNQPDIENWKSAFNCYVGKCQFWVSWDGRLTPCGMLNLPEAFPLEQGFMNAYKAMNQEVAKIPPCEDCRECDDRDACMTCPAKLYAETGKYNEKADYLCARMREKYAVSARNTAYL